MRSLGLASPLSLLLLAAGCGDTTQMPVKDMATAGAPPDLQLPPCQGDTVRCGMTCVDTKTSLQHCGACDKACDVGFKCADAKCVIVCPMGQTACGDNNCCAQGQVCNMGACAMGCAMGLTACSGTCVDVQIDLKNCGKCAMACGQGQLCKAGACVDHCKDMQKNGDETDVDCGGLACAERCDTGKSCAAGGDCKSGLCFNQKCVAPGCGDGIKNQTESDVDCGGPCPGCDDGKLCGASKDCRNGVCTNGTCQKAGCMDKIKNGDETDVDCGGACPPCKTMGGCKTGKDCESGICVNSQCQEPSCKDGVKNGNETDLDCGGPCPPCGPTKGCNSGADCWNKDCAGNKCGSSASVGVGGMGNPAFDPKGDGSRLVIVDGNGNVTVDRQTSLLNIARFIYVSNSGEGTVSKVDPGTAKEVARYCTAPGCNADPSRASVSLDGNAGVANRADYFFSGNPKGGKNIGVASAVVIAGNKKDCVDRNGNGKIDTFEGEGVVPQQFIWPANTTISPDECVLWWTPLTKDRNGNVVGGGGTLPRSATFDSKASPDGAVLSSNFYVGLYGTSEVVQLDAKTGAIKNQVALPGAPYSSVFDRFGNLWIRDSNTSRMIRVDTNSPNLANGFVGPAAPCAYAITADRRGFLYSAGGNCVSRMDPNQPNPQWETLTLPNACFPRGSSLDANFNLWVPDTCYGGYHIDASSATVANGQMKLVKQFALAGDKGQYILGTALDGNGLPFFVNTELPGNPGNCCGTYFGNQGTVYKVDYKNNYAVTKIKVGMQPYVYSDLSGSQLALTAPTTGSYVKNFTAFCGNKATWTDLKWTSTTPAMTTLKILYRAGKDAAAADKAPTVQAGAEPPAAPQPVKISLPMGTDPSVLQVEFIISTSDTQNKPTLGNVTVSYTCPAQ